MSELNAKIYGRTKVRNRSSHSPWYDTNSLVSHPVIPVAKMHLEDILRNIDEISFIKKVANQPLTQSEIDLIEYMEFSLLAKGMGLTK